MIESPIAGSAATVVVVEDEAVIADAVAARLRADGHRVEVAADGPAGVALCQQVAPDLVVLDLMLPGLDGYEVCRRVQAHRPVLVLMLAARDEEADVVVALRMGADDYLTKPFSTRELSARVAALLRRSAPYAEDRSFSAEVSPPWPAPTASRPAAGGVGACQDAIGQPPRRRARTHIGRREPHERLAGHCPVDDPRYLSGRMVTVSAAARPLTVVTGGGRGIGAATVAHLVRHGHDVVLGYLSDRVAADEVVAAARALGARGSGAGGAR